MVPFRWIYMHQPLGFVDKQHPSYVCKHEKALYSLKQAPRAWNACFSSYLTRLGFITSRCDPSLFVYKRGHDLPNLILYADDIVLTSVRKRTRLAA